ncbi:MAG TPA: winged helix-turn-helix transcriptional regulator [Streptosporangiaceae bacterium]|nr:winged helix-turn-helix transcriptional regulator [Streptosporangiaceae bacterium]
MSRPASAAAAGASGTPGPAGNALLMSLRSFTGPGCLVRPRRITQKMLTQQLRELEADGLVTRTVFDQVPPKVVYDIQPAERARLDELLQALCSWGLYWSGKTGARILAFEHGAGEPATA